MKNKVIHNNVDSSSNRFRINFKTNNGVGQTFENAAISIFQSL